MKAAHHGTHGWIMMLCLLWLGVASGNVVRANLYDPANPIYQDTIAYFAMDGNAKEATGSGANGLLAGPPTPAAGISETCYNFNGIDQSINVPGDLLYVRQPEALTISAWVYQDANPDPFSFRLNTVFARIAGYESSIQLTITGQGNLFLYHRNWFADNYFFSDAPVPPGGWHHVGVTIDQDAVRFYIDGRPAGEALSLGPIWYGSFHDSTSIGVCRDSYGPYDFFMGRIDELAVFGRALSAGEMRTLGGGTGGGNQDPVAGDDAAETGEDSAVTVDVLANDSDPDGDALTITDFGQGAHGSVTLNEDNTLTYTPNENWSGQDSFAYGISDGQGGTATGGVTVTVQPVNDAPVAYENHKSLSEDNPLELELSASDADGDPLEFIIVNPPAHGQLSGTPPYMTYTPAANANGADRFDYVASDGQAQSNLGTFYLTITPVNDPPVAAADPDYVVSEDSSLNVAAPGVLGNDSDVDGDALAAVLVIPPAHGSLSFNPDGSFSYTPEANFSGTDQFSYLAGDGSLESNITQAMITVKPVNDAPVAYGQTLNLSEDEPLNIVLTGSDIEGSPLAFTVVDPPARGTLSGSGANLTYTPALNDNGPVSFTFKVNDGELDSAIATVNLNITPVNDPPAGVADPAYTVNEDSTLNVPAPGVLGNDSDVDGDALSAVLVTPPAHGVLTLSANGAFSYMPESNFNGTDHFTYRANDGSLASLETQVTITVWPVNDAPVAYGQNRSLYEDGLLAVTLTGSDVENNPLTFTIYEQPLHGRLNGAAPNVTYIPETDYNGSDRFTFRVWDGGLNSNIATVNLTVQPVNDVPVVTSKNLSLAEDTSIFVTLTGSDVDGDPLSFSVVTPPAHGQLSGTLPNLTYYPEPNYNGPDRFDFVANDGKSNSSIGSVNLTVRPINDRPVAAADPDYVVDEDSTLNVTAPGVLGNDSDVDGDAILAVLLTPPAHGTLTLNANGSFGYTPETNFNGTDRFIYRAYDGRAYSTNTRATITVRPVNDAPVAYGQSLSLKEDEPLSIVLAGSDIEGSPLAFTVVDPPARGTLSGSGANLTYTPALNDNGPVSFTFKVNDGELDSAIATVNLNITPVNDPPAVGAITGPVQAVLAGNAVAVSAPFSDPDAGDAWTAVWNWGDGTSSSLNLDGSSWTVSGSHIYGQAGIYEIRLTVTDKAGASDTEVYRYVVVYDPAAGTVTGGGFLKIEENAQMIFTFNARYPKGAAESKGQAEIQFKMSNLDFKGTIQDWLVVSGAKAVICGSGTNNGGGDYGFLITAIDGDLLGKKQADKLRVKIWNEASGEIIYDTQPGAEITVDPALTLSGGNIAIHK